MLLRSFVNDVYAVSTPSRRYVFKLYRHGRWSADEVGWELDLAGHRDAFAGGYTETRALTDGELAALPWFAVVAGICNLGFHLIDKRAFSGIESVSEGWAEDELAGLRAAAGELL